MFDQTGKTEQLTNLQLADMQISEDQNNDYNLGVGVMQDRKSPASTIMANRSPCNVRTKASSPFMN